MIPQKSNKGKYMKFILFTLTILAACLCISTSCATVKEIPVQTVEKIVYRDSLIYVKDTLHIEIPRETIREVVPELDTSYLKTSLAESKAYLDTKERRIHHTLTQHGELKIKYDTVVKVQYVDRIVEQEVPVQVEVIKYKRDALFWVLAGWAFLCVFYAVLSFVLKKYIK